MGNTGPAHTQLTEHMVHSIHLWSTLRSSLHLLNRAVEDLLNRVLGIGGSSTTAADARWLLFPGHARSGAQCSETLERKAHITKPAHTLFLRTLNCTI